MPDGLDAELEENGRNLSGGQRQRLAVARAVVRDPRLVLLDEPTAFLDAEAAVALEKRLAAWGQDRLLILVTHHLAAARNADAILVLDQGRLVGFGAHTRLLAGCAPYAALWSDYSRSMEGESSRKQRLERLYFFRTAAARSATSSLRAHPIWTESFSLSASICLASVPAKSASKRGAIPSAVTATTTRPS